MHYNISKSLFPPLLEKMPFEIHGIPAKALNIARISQYRCVTTSSFETIEYSSVDDFTSQSLRSLDVNLVSARVVSNPRNPRSTDCEKLTTGNCEVAVSPVVQKVLLSQVTGP